MRAEAGEAFLNMAKVAIVDYGMGNVASVRNAFLSLGADATITARAEAFEDATHIVLPGVGAFGDGMRNLRAHGLVDVLTHEAIEKRKPFLGICLGMQLLADMGEEGGENEGLGWIHGRVRRFRVDEKRFRVPHVGWDDVEPKPGEALFDGIASPIFYFVHSFFFDGTEDSDVIATCDYGERFTAAVRHGNVMGVQFHPEKSQKSGLALLKNFLEIA
ncbi:MAG: imidazole glycerol phosphate synthase subunit HisH [Patescibacteria group bacterium]